MIQERHSFPKAMISVDLGGTKIMGARFIDGNLPSLCDRVKITTPTGQDRQAASIEAAVVKVIKGILTNCSSREAIAGIGVCSTGLVDPSTGQILRSVNLPFHNHPLKANLSDTFQLPVVLENDSKAAAIGEYFYGAGAGKQWPTMLHIVVGTGIGGAIVHEGALIPGSSFSAGEFGHMSIDPEGAQCRCGGRGCVDAYASGYAITQFVRGNLGNEKLSDPFSISLSQHSDLPHIITAAENGHFVAVAALKRAGAALGLMVSNLVHVLNPDGIVFSGGVLHASSLIWRDMMCLATERSFPSAWARTQICRATLGEDSGLFGMAHMMFSSQ